MTEQSTQNSPAKGTVKAKKTGINRLLSWNLSEIFLAMAALGGIIVTFWVIAAALASGKALLFDASNMELGLWKEGSSIFAYHPEEKNILILNDSTGKFMRYSSPAVDQWEGFGILGDIAAPKDAYLRLEWRNSDEADRFVSIFITDNSKDPTGRIQPENFMSNLLLPKGEWQSTIIPLSQFVRNSWQETGASEDGVLETQSMRRIEVGLGPSQPSMIDVRTIELVWETVPNPILVVTPLLGLLAALGVLFLKKPARFLPDKPSIIESRAVLALTIGYALASTLSASPLSPPSILPLAIMLSSILIVLVDEQCNKSFQGNFWWRLRFLPISLLYVFSPQVPNVAADCLILPILVSPFLTLNNFPAFAMSLTGSLGAIILRRLLVSGTVEMYPAVILVCVTLILVGAYFYLRVKSTSSESRIASHLYKGVMTLAQDMILILDESGRVESMNLGAEQVLKITSRQARGKAMEELLTMRVDWTELLGQLKVKEESLTMELQALDEWGGRTFYNVRVQRFPIEDRHNRFVLILRDVSQQKHLEEELRAANARLSAIAFLDGLTGIASRRAFDQALDLEWKRSRRNRYPLGLLLMDVDHFKAYNDEFGHLKGDEALRVIASCLKSFTRRPEDICARYGGEEFVILFPGMGPEDLKQTAEGIREAVEKIGIQHKTSHGCITISIGGASSSANPAESTPSSLIHTADIALYQAKNQGRNRTVVTVIPNPAVSSN